MTTIVAARRGDRRESAGHDTGQKTGVNFRDAPEMPT
jgi:hypothetical protein